jgi:hypothetical protein
MFFISIFKFVVWILALKAKNLCRKPNALKGWKMGICFYKAPGRANPERNVPGDNPDYNQKGYFCGHF